MQLESPLPSQQQTILIERSAADSTPGQAAAAAAAASSATAVRTALSLRMAMRWAVHRPLSDAAVDAARLRMQRLKAASGRVCVAASGPAKGRTTVSGSGSGSAIIGVRCSHSASTAFAHQSAPHPSRRQSAQQRAGSERLAVALLEQHSGPPPSFAREGSVARCQPRAVQCSQYSQSVSRPLECAGVSGDGGSVRRVDVAAMASATEVTV